MHTNVPDMYHHTHLCRLPYFQMCISKTKTIHSKSQMYSAQSVMTNIKVITTNINQYQ